MVKQALGDDAKRHDVEAIADESAQWDPVAHAFDVVDDHDEFWEIVEKHKLTP